MLSYGLASGSWAGVTPEEAAARGVALVQPDRARPRARGHRARSRAPGPVIGQRFPLERAADAHAAIEARATVGKTLLESDGAEVPCGRGRGRLRVRRDAAAARGSIPAGLAA